MMRWIQQLKSGLFGDPHQLKLARQQREDIRTARRRAEDRHIEDTQDILASSIRELLNSESASAEIDAAIRSVKDAPATRGRSHKGL